MLSVCHDQPYDDIDVNDPDVQQMFQQVSAFNETLQSTGTWVFGAGLAPISSATVVRNVGGDVSMTDGPFAETKEHVGGFYIIDVADLDAALDWAGKASAACGRPIEVRPADG
jgi:hypothetical protein